MIASIAVVGAGIPAPASAVSLADRTLRVSTDLNLGDTEGRSQNPVLSVDGRTMAFETTAPDFAPHDVNGPRSDVVGVDLLTGTRRLITEAADGPSVTPTISGDGSVIAFVTYAANLVTGDVNGLPDVQVRAGRGPVVPVSVAPDGGPANGRSYEPDISNDGRFVAFTSEASNLVRGDANGAPDVFVRDLATGRTELVSRAGEGRQGNGRSSQPAISGDGRYVAFESMSTNLVEKDTNRIADVFVVDRRTGKTTRVSVSSRGRQQNGAVPSPFTMVPDISRNGRYVVFESDATNLTRDGNRRTDVFLRDLKRSTTRIVSASSLNVQGDNDSFNPRISANGRYVAFQSFARNLVSREEDGPREDIFVRDVRTGTTSIASVTTSGAPRAAAPEQFLQRPAVSNDARIVAFASTATNLVAGDGNANADVFLRRMDAASTRVVRKATKKRRSIAVGADDPRATRFVCRVDDDDPYFCGPSIKLRKGLRLTVRAGGPGIMFDPDGVSLRLSKDKRRPRIRITKPRGRSLRTVRGRVSDAGGSGIDRVEVSVVYFGKDGRCRFLRNRRFVRQSCGARRVFTLATGKRSWRLRLPHSIRGPILLDARATDGAGNRSRIASRAVVLGG